MFFFSCFHTCVISLSWTCQPQCSVGSEDHTLTHGATHTERDTALRLLDWVNIIYSVDTHYQVHIGITNRN